MHWSGRSKGTRCRSWRTGAASGNLGFGWMKLPVRGFHWADLPVHQIIPINPGDVEPPPQWSFAGCEWIHYSRDGGIEAKALLMPVEYALPPFIVLPAAWVNGRWRRHITNAGHCQTCGYELRATPNRCPECGAVGPCRTCVLHNKSVACTIRKVARIRAYCERPRWPSKLVTLLDPVQPILNGLPGDVVSILASFSIRSSRSLSFLEAISHHFPALA